MIRKIMAVVCVCLFVSGSMLFAQQEITPQAPNAQDLPPEAGPDPSEEISWVWGEIKSVDTAQLTITLSYLDYQTEEEKELNLSVDAQTKYENAADLASLKQGEIASIDYTVKDGKNIARTISIEKMEEPVVADSPETPKAAEPEPPETPKTAEPAVQ